MNKFNIIPEDYEFLKDEEVITADCLCFGQLETGKTGWGKPPQWLVGQHYCEGWKNHPEMIAKKITATAQKSP